MRTLDLTNRKTSEELSKLPAPTNQSLRLLLQRIDAVVIKDDGVYNGRALSDKILFRITEANYLDQFFQLLEIDEAKAGFYCMCLGTYAIEFFSNTELKATIGFHHGESIRYDQWNGDAQLLKSDELLAFLSGLGFSEPLQDRLEERTRMKAEAVAEDNWFDMAPAFFRQYRSQIINLDHSFMPLLIENLNAAYPDKYERVIVLLQIFGKTDSFWNAYPVYEQIPFDILKQFEVKDIIAAYLASDRNYKARRGLGRYLCLYEFKKVRDQYLKFIPLQVVDDLEKCFEAIGEKKGINEIYSLRNQVCNNIS